ncbi:MAG TPA: ABC-type transport auxiliary lipoprotein family protein [Noviherbaspirillum sp.]
MKKNIALMMLAAALTACVLQPIEPPTLYDLGPLRPAAKALPALPALAVAEVSVPAWLDRPLMFYRLNYENDQEPRSYAHSRWVMPPAQLITQRVKARMAQAGSVVLSASDGARNMPLLHIEVDDFTQNFDVPGQSVGRFALRASVFKEQILVAQKSFATQAPAPSADAVGGARALASASDAAIGEMMQWLAGLPLK